MLDVQEIVDDVIKSPEDGSLYRGLVLKNNLKVLLVSDPSTDKAAAAMDVHSGTRHLSQRTHLETISNES